MRTINISEPVWLAIAALGKFGETEDDVLRRVFNLPPMSNPERHTSALRSDLVKLRSRSYPPRRSQSTNRMSSYISNNMLHVSFEGGAAKSWSLPSQDDKIGIRTVRDKAVDFAKENGASLGQVNAVKKALTDSGYHLVK